MKNLKLNKQFLSLLTAGVVLLTTGCNANKQEKEFTLETMVSDRSVVGNVIPDDMLLEEVHVFNIGEENTELTVYNLKENIASDIVVSAIREKNYEKLEEYSEKRVTTGDFLVNSDTDVRIVYGNLDISAVGVFHNKLTVCENGEYWNDESLYGKITGEKLSEEEIDHLENSITVFSSNESFGADVEHFDFIGARSSDELPSGNLVIDTPKKTK